MLICNCSLAGTEACDYCNNKLYDNFGHNEIKIMNSSKINIGHPVVQYWCSECDALLRKYDKYCHNCGCKIDWEQVEDDNK